MKRYSLLKMALWFVFQYINQLFREKINNQLKHHSQCNHQIRLITFPSSSSWLQPLYVLIDFKMLFLKCVFIPKNIVNWDLSCWLATVYAFIRLHRRCSPSSGSLRPVLHPKPAAKIWLTTSFFFFFFPLPSPRVRDPSAPCQLASIAIGACLSHRRCMLLISESQVGRSGSSWDKKTTRLKFLLAMAR